MIFYIIFLYSLILCEMACLPHLEQACIQLITGPLHCQNCGKALSSPKCELSYRLLSWNSEMENFVGAPTGIEPVSPAFRAGVLTTTPQHPVTVYSSPKCELSYRLLPWNPEMENFVGVPTGIELMSQALRAGMLTTTLKHPGTKFIKFGSSNKGL